VGIFSRILLGSSRILEKYNKQCHAMHPMQDYFWKDFYMHNKFDMQPICTSMLAKFYSCKKWVLQTYPLKGISPSRFRKHLGIIRDNLF
jgi:hypothetical protein